MNAKHVCAIAVPALVCGALLGWVLKPAPVVPAAPADVPAEKHAKKAKPVTDDAALNRLRRRIEDLEKQLAAALAATNAPVVAQEEPVTNRNPFGWGRRNGPPTAEEMRAHMEEIKKNDPERYTQMTNHFAQWRTRRLERAQNQLDLLSSVDTTHMSKGQRKTHEKYQDLIARQEELRELMNPQNEDVTEEQRKAAFEEMRTIGHQLRELAHQERDTLLTQTANALGYTGDAAGEIVDSIKAVYQATESHGWHGGHGGGHHGRGGAGGPPPGGPR